jgi:nucleoside permease NupC
LLLRNTRLESHGIIHFPNRHSISLLTIILPTRNTVITGLFFQQAIALFVLRSSAGFSIFKWIAILASDFLAESTPAAQFFFDAETVAKHWFFVNTLAAIIFFIAFIQMMYYVSYSWGLACPS